METINLKGATLYYQADFLNSLIANKLFKWLKTKIEWKQESTAFGRTFPRLTAFIADQDLKYSYSGVVHTGVGWHPILEEIRQKVVSIPGSDSFNSLLLNYYRDGKDSIGWHADDEKELGENPVVASISLGATREFQMKHKNGVKIGKYNINLSNGSLLIMAGDTQKNWLHSVPKTKDSIGEKINLTFRKIL